MNILRRRWRNKKRRRAGPFHEKKLNDPSPFDINRESKFNLIEPRIYIRIPFDPVLSSLIRFYWVLLFFLLGLTGFHWVLLGFTGFYQAL